MKTLLVFVLCLCTLVYSTPATPCEYVDNEAYLNDTSLVKECFDSITVTQEFVDAIYNTLQRIGDYYPYVDISRNPPSPYFNTVDYNAEMTALKEKLDNSGLVLSKVIRPTQEFIAKFRDGHFSLSFNKNMTNNTFVPVKCGFPFMWDFENFDDVTARVYVAPSEYSAHFFEVSDLQILDSKKNVAVSTVDDVDAFEFFSLFFGKYDDMKSQQGSLQYTKYATIEGFSILRIPLDDDVLFGEHTMKYSDGTEFKFHMAFANTNNLFSVRSDASSSPISFFTLKQEEEILRVLKDYTPKPVRSRDLRDNKYILCGHEDGMNYITVGTFSPADVMDTILYINELSGCFEELDKNSDPITVLLPMNGGGSLLLEQMLEVGLMPNSEYRMLVAVRKTDSAKKILVDGNYGAALADLDNKCTNYASKEDLEKAWEPTVVDDFGNGVKHNRTEKYFMAFKDAMAQLGLSTLKKNVRKPTDIIIATDGFCFSACSVFVLDAIRKGFGIITGYGPTNPGDTNFVAAQCPSSVIEPKDYFDDVSNYTSLGLRFASTIMESYNISTDKKEIIPGDFEIMNIDKHLVYNVSINPKISDMIPYLKEVHNEFKTKCNPLNTRLFLVDSNCEVNDKNALDAGYVCGANYEWDKTKCKISTCKPGYVVDFDNNKCVENPCDVRSKPVSSDPSSCSVIYPVMAFIVTILSVIAFF